MKTLRRLVLAAFAAGLLIASPALAQRTIATYSQEAMANLSRLLQKGANDGYNFELKTTTIFGAGLPKGNKNDKEPWVGVLILQKADPNKSYRIIAAGDNDADDLDLRILDPAGNVVTEDTTTAKEAEVTFRPARQQDYTIQLRLYDSKNRCVCIGAILTK